MADQASKQKASEKLLKLVDDILTLDVITLSGNITIKDLDLGDGRVNFLKIMDKIKGDASTASKIKVVAATRFDFDKDVQQFVKEKLTEEEKALFQIHIETIKNAQETRKAVIDALIDIVS